MKILIAGSHGMVGSAVTRHLIESRHEVVRLVRKVAGANEIWWNPDTHEIDKTKLDGFDGVVNVASMPWPFRWTKKAKQKIYLNRLEVNRLLAESLAECDQKPRVFICASGIGYYPSSVDETLTEESPVGTSFLARLDKDCEDATTSASAAGIRVVHLRIPTVLGGARLQMLGFQGGDGRQWMSWIGRDELASIIEFVLTNESLCGPVNTVSPNPLRSAEFASRATTAMGQKPGGVMPAFIVRLVFGEMGEEFILASRRAEPTKLINAGYRFRFPELEDTLRHEMQYADTGLKTEASEKPGAVHA